MKTTWSKINAWVGYSMASGIIIFATLVNISHLLTPYLNAHKAEFETWASDLLKSPVIIDQVVVVWDIYRPEIAFNKVTVLDVQTHKPTLGIKHIKVSFNMIASLFAWKPVTDSIIIDGVNLTLHQFKAGGFHIEGLRDLPMTDNFTGANFNSDSAFSWIFSVEKLALKDIEIHYLSEKGVERFITLNRLALMNGSNHHTLTGQAILNQDIPSRVDIDLKWRGSFADLTHISANLYLYVEGVTLSQVLNNQTWNQLQLKEGLASAKIWAKWDHDQLEGLRTQFQLFQLEWQTVKDHKMQYLPRVSGAVVWRREGDKQVVTGNDILIDFPDHLWPTTSFSVSYMPSANGMYSIQSLDVGYLNLKDTKELLITNKLLPDAYQQLLTAFDPKGEVRSLHAAGHDAWADTAKVVFSSQLIGLTFNEWQKFPGVKNITGSIAWDGKNANVKLNSQKAGLTYFAMFPKSLFFDQASVDINAQKQADSSWKVNANNINLHSADLTLQASLGLVLPVTDSPTVNFTSDFNVVKLVNISKYLPMKIFEAGLAEWLNKAFLAGSLDAGKMVFQGRLSDFPFENKNGKFDARGTLHNVELNYAPKWPVMQHVNGELVFSGRSMTLNIPAAQIANAPLTQVKAEILHLGDSSPAILNVQGMITGDLSQALHFIQISPLQNSLGKDLSGLKMTGPMNLKIGLVVPLKNTDAINVVGDVAFQKALLNLPDWNLALDNLAGTFRFTENDIQSTPIRGFLFGAPVVLNLSTQHVNKKPAYVKADLNGTISTAVLEKWLKMPLSDYIQGSTAYAAELHLGAHEKNQANEVILKSDLQGININLPEQYGKKAQVKTDFKLDIVAAPSQPIKIKMDYDKLLSVALTYAQSQGQLKLFGGEVRLGPGANWQTKPGVLVTGQIDELDWAKLQKYFPMKNAHTDTSLLRGVDVFVKTLTFVGQQFKNINIQLEKFATSWQLTLDNNQIRGHVTVPLLLRQGIQAKFDRLHITASGSSASNPVNPRTLPPIYFIGNDVRVNDKSFGYVKLSLIPSGNGLMIRDLYMESPVLKLQARGDWQATKNGSYTHLQGDSSTAKVSDVLTAWGFNSSNFVGGKGDVKFDLSWPDAPFSPSDKLTGKLSLHLDAGRIVDIGDSGTKMGIGRMLSILSLQTIPRRLSLNFSDLFEKGYSFDSMNGDFTFRNRNMMTDNTELVGPVADIEISGRVGLQAKDFDLKLGVTPHVTSSIPLVATYVGGPIVGAAAWVVDKVVSGAVSKITTYEYHITGPWDKPNWNQYGGK